MPGDGCLVLLAILSGCGASASVQAEAVADFVTKLGIPPLPQISVFLRCPRWDSAKVEQTPFKFLDRLTNFPYPPITSPTHSGWSGHSFFFDKLIEFCMPHAAKLEY
jgi:hypothetical protein